MNTPYLILDDVEQQDSNGCTQLDYASDDTLILASITSRGRQLLASGLDVRRVIELGEAQLTI